LRQGKNQPTALNGEPSVYQDLPEKPLTKEDGFDRLARGEPFAAFVGRCEELSVSTGSFKGQTMANLFSVLVIEQMR
jgi:hypothetical protein